MSAYDRVADYLKGMPAAEAHRQKYATDYLERARTNPTTVVNGAETEKKVIPGGESNIIGRLHCALKFTKRDMHVGINVGATVAAGQKHKTQKTQVYRLDFLGSREWMLRPAKARAAYAHRESTMHLVDEAQQRVIMSKCPNVSGLEAGGLSMTSIHERLATPTDTRHLFMKMYLMLMDYNLAVSSRLDGMAVSNDPIQSVFANVPGNARLAYVQDHDVVIDAKLFSASELGMLAMAGQAYPSVWYAGDNMYNKCCMEADDLVIISDGQIALDTSWLWGSPDRMYNTMWLIAQKMNAVPCLLDAIASMRGKPKLVADMMKRIDSNTIASMVPKSFNLETAFGQIGTKCSITNMPGYVSTSMSLVSDLLYGMSFEAATSCVVEELGGIGTLVSSSTPKTCKTINGIFRDYGLQHSSPEYNFMLRNWELVAGSPTTWSFGKHLKDYALGIAGEIINGNDIIMPQILMCIPYLTTVHTAWGMSRGWQGTQNVLQADKENRRKDKQQLASVAWVMGQRAVRPNVFHNKAGHKELFLGGNEYLLDAESQGDLVPTDVQFWIEDSCGGRVDENEEVSSALFRTEYAGTKCALVYSYLESQWVEQAPPDYEAKVSETMRGEVIEPKEAASDKVDVKPVTSGGAPRRGEDPFKHLRMLNKGLAIRPSNRPRHVRTNSAYEATVPTYSRDGDLTSTPISYKDPNPAEGKEIEFSEIDVPHDGECGIHAVVEDLKAHGMISATDVLTVHNMFAGELATRYFSDAQDIAAVCQKWGFGLDLFDKGTGRFTRYGNTKGNYNVSLIRDGNHFVAADFTKGPKKTKIAKFEQQSISEAEYIARTDKFKQFFA